MKFHDETFLEGSVEYNTSNGTCTFTSSGSYSAASSPTHGMLSYGTLDHVVQSGDVCNGHKFTYAVVYYTWTDNQSGAMQDSFAVEWKTPDGKVGGPYDYVVQLSTPVITSGIAFGGANIAGMPPQSVYIGQQIALTGYPAPANGQTLPWQVTGNGNVTTGNPVGGFSLTPDSSGNANGMGHVVLADYSKGSTTFYWTETGKYQVTFTPTPGGAPMIASFSVDGPKVAVSSPPGGPIVAQKLDNDSDYSLSCGYRGDKVKCAEFDLITPDAKGGSFQWVQTVLYDQTRQQNIGSQKYIPCHTPPGLDTSYPLDLILTCKAGLASCDGDSPNSSLAGLTYLHRFFSARMYAMWNPDMQLSIPVPLGSTNWLWEASTTFNAATGTWPMPNIIKHHIGTFQHDSVFPDWNMLLTNGHDFICP